jgi:cytochrome P450
VHHHGDEGVMSVNPAVDPSFLSRPETWQDPYPVFRQLQQHTPVCFSAAMGGWLLTRYDDVSAALRDPRLSSRRSAAFAQRLPPALQERVAALVRHLAGWTLFTDAPDHTRLRALINKGFSMRLVEAMRPRLQSIVDNLLEGVEARGEFEVMHDLAIPLPVIVIGGMLGLPEGDYQRLREWSDALAPFFSGRVDADTVGRAATAVAELDSYFAPLIAARRERPGDDLVSSLMTAEEEGRILDDQEIRSTCVMLLFAGHETTTHLIGNGLYTLLRHPEERDRLTRSPHLGHGAVEEVLRYESPVQWQSRVALEDVELRAQRVPRNARVFLMLGAANRDPAHFAEPDRFDITRRNNKHVAFGQGPHYCVGAALGRLEALIAIQSSLKRFPRLRLLDPAPSWFDNSVLRGLKQLRLAAA